MRIAMMIPSVPVGPGHGVSGMPQSVMPINEKRNASPNETSSVAAMGPATMALTRTETSGYATSHSAAIFSPDSVFTPMIAGEARR